MANSQTLREIKFHKLPDDSLKNLSLKRASNARRVPTEPNRLTLRHVLRFSLSPARMANHWDSRHCRPTIPAMFSSTWKATRWFLVDWNTFWGKHTDRRSGKV